MFCLVGWGRNWLLQGLAVAVTGLQAVTTIQAHWFNLNEALPATLTSLPFPLSCRAAVGTHPHSLRFVEHVDRHSCFSLNPYPENFLTLFLPLTFASAEFCIQACLLCLLRSLTTCITYPSARSRKVAWSSRPRAACLNP